MSGRLTCSCGVVECVEADRKKSTTCAPRGVSESRKDNENRQQILSLFIGNKMLQSNVKMGSDVSILMLNTFRTVQNNHNLMSKVFKHEGASEQVHQKT